MERFLVPHTWDLSEEDVAKIEKSNLGDLLHIDEPWIPLVFEDEDGYFIYAFTSEETMSEDYLNQGCAIVICPLMDILLEMLAIEKILGKAPILAIDPFNDECQELTKEQVEALLQSFE